MMTTTPTIKGSQIQSATMEVMVKMERILAAKADHQVKVVMVQGSSSECQLSFTHPLTKFKFHH